MGHSKKIEPRLSHQTVRDYLSQAKQLAASRWPNHSNASIERAAVIGAGTMGTGIALALAWSGIETMLVDKDSAALERARGRLDKENQKAIRRGMLSKSKGAAALQKITLGETISKTGNLDLAIEAAFESLAVKQKILAKLDLDCPAHTILATNTSTLDLDLIAQSTSRPEQVIGLHFFSPAHVMPLIEIVRGKKTSTSTIEAGVQIARRLGKVGIVVGNCYGFAGNRMIEGMSREANRLLLEGTSVKKIDSALRSFGMAMGPLEVADLVGIDVPYQARLENSQALPSDSAYYHIANKLVELGRLGQKSGRGYYKYEEGQYRGQPDPDIERLSLVEAERLGIERSPSTKSEIIDRCILPVINEGAKILGEGIADRASDLDLIYTLGYGFPKDLGGPMHYADSLKIASVRQRLRELRERHGDYWTPAPLLTELADSNSSFAEFDLARASQCT